MTFTVTRQRAQEVHDLARARAGLRYAYGGAFTRDPRVSTDCSGLVLQTAAWYGGRTDWPGNRYGSTESFRLNHKIVYDLGFKRLPAGGPAALPFRPVMLVGLQHGGGGVNSHTACTLMTMDYPGGPVVQSARGVDWESRGSGVFLYDGARAWNDRLFHDFWYLDASLEGAAATGSGAVTLANATGLSLGRATEILPTFVEGLRLAECTNPRRIGMFTAQTGHESDNFNATEEYASGAAYEGRCSDLGNCQPGDGVKFKGRTWIQVTGRAHYASFSKWAHSKGLVPTPTHFVDNPRELAELRWAGVGAAWYWTVARPQINSLCDAGDLIGVTKAINGGLNGLEDRNGQPGRRTRYNRAMALGDELLSLLSLIATTEPFDPWEELFMSNTPLESISLYATPGETRRFTPAEMLQSVDGMTHRALVERDARLGDADALARIVRVARGEGKYRDQAAIDHAISVLAEIDGKTTDQIRALLKGQPA